MVLINLSSVLLVALSSKIQLFSYAHKQFSRFPRIVFLQLTFLLLVVLVFIALSAGTHYV